MTTLDAKIEAVLFWKAEPMALSKLVSIFATTEEDVRASLAILEEKLSGRGVSLVWKDDEVTLRTAPDVSALIESLSREELTRDLGKAGLETLSIILYQGPLSRRDIDYIRGVNSNFILRNLLVRGLIEKVENPKDQRSFLYKPTFDLLSFLGVTKLEELPEYGTVRTEIDTFKQTTEAEQTSVPEEEDVLALSDTLSEDSHE